jgi:hypothetical protein
MKNLITKLFLRQIIVDIELNFFLKKFHKIHIFYLPKAKHSNLTEFPITGSDGVSRRKSDGIEGRNESATPAEENEKIKKINYKLISNFHGHEFRTKLIFSCREILFSGIFCSEFILNKLITTEDYGDVQRSIVTITLICSDIQFEKWSIMSSL